MSQHEARRQAHAGQAPRRRGLPTAPATAAPAAAAEDSNLLPSTSGREALSDGDVVPWLQQQYGIMERRWVGERADRALAALQALDPDICSLSLERDFLPKLEVGSRVALCCRL